MTRFKLVARDDVMEAGDHLRQAVLGCFNNIFTSAGSSDERTKAEQELKALEATDGRRYGASFELMVRVNNKQFTMPSRFRSSISRYYNISGLSHPR